MVEDLKAKTEAWMEEKQIHDLFDLLTSKLFYALPDDPKAFLIETLQTIQKVGGKPLLDAEDFRIMFGMFDVTRRGYLTRKQAYAACRSILGKDSKMLNGIVADSLDEVTTLTEDQFVRYLSENMHESKPF